jgi:hypothetical protein
MVRWADVIDETIFSERRVLVQTFCNIEDLFDSLASILFHPETFYGISNARSHFP